MIIRSQPDIQNPAEGIDTISFVLNPCFVNRSQWYKNPQLQDYITLRTYGGEKKYFTVHVQFEALDMRDNLYEQVIHILMRLFCENILCIPDGKICSTTYDLCKYILQNLHYIAKLTALDFYFDFKCSDIKKYKLPAHYKSTNYSIDHARSNSLWIVYDRRENLKTQNQIPHNLIDSMPYPMRVEIRLRRGNCKYLNFNNLYGEYYHVIYRGYLNYVAKSWRKYHEQLALVCPTDYHPVFNNILQISAMESISMLPLAKNDSYFK